MTTIGNLRRARVRCHRQMKATEALLAGYTAKLAELEAAIHAIDPELPLTVSDPSHVSAVRWQRTKHRSKSPSWPPRD
jgi:hypothetical protein